MGWSCPSTAACRPSESADLRECMFVKALTGIRWITKVGISEVGASSAVESWGTNVNTDWRSIMSYAIVGFGKIGQALALAFARKNIGVTVASRRLPEALAPQARAIGPTVVAKSLRDALDADTIILAVPFEEHPAVAKALPRWKGKTVIDAMNALAPLEELGGRA